MTGEGPRKPSECASYVPRDTLKPLAPSGEEDSGGQVAAVLMKHLEPGVGEENQPASYLTFTNPIRTSVKAAQNGSCGQTESESVSQ